MASRTLRAALAGVAIITSVAFSAPATADDVSEVAVVAGTGAIEPGLTTVCTNQHVTFGGTAVSVGTHAGTFTFTFDGFSAGCETLTAGQGSGTLSGAFSGRVDYVRNGNIVTLTGTGALGTAAHHITRGICEFIPTSVNPTEDYALVCEVVLGEGA